MSAPAETRLAPGFDPRAEWLETDGLGGFASGTVAGPRTRRYHALLLAAQTPPAGRVALVNGIEAWVERDGRSFFLSSQRYAPDVTHPDGARRLIAFEREPWPRWTWTLEGRGRVVLELFAVHGAAATVLRWRLEDAGGSATLCVRPFLSGRDFHAVQRENGAFRFEPEGAEPVWTFRPYDGVPAIEIRASATYAHEPLWYRDFLLEDERARGLDAIEDLASPGAFRFDLAEGEAAMVLGADGAATALARPNEGVVALARRLASAERERRAGFGDPLLRAADQYVVARGAGRTLIAGYPWFGDWGRDTFIALRGLCLATGRLDVARDILLEWSGAVSEGMLPNRFPDRGETPEYNAVDASLWYVVAVHEWREAMARDRRRVAPRDAARLDSAVSAILLGYAGGARYGIRMDDDGLLAAGAPGVQLTWMDAKVGERVITPRIGKPVEIQALWINALRIGAALSTRWAEAHATARAAFEARFYDEGAGQLHDVVDVDHARGVVDRACRPNQIFAIGGLPFAALEGPRAERVVETVERRLLTPLGLRSLAPSEPGYAPRYAGGPAERDGVYHQGTVWPWLAGPFVEAWVRVRGGTARARREAAARFLPPLREHLGVAGLGHVSEVADGDAPHAPAGCPFQAWSLGELLRLERVVLADAAEPAAARPAGRRAVRPRAGSRA